MSTAAFQRLGIVKGNAAESFGICGHAFGFGIKPLYKVACGGSGRGVRIGIKSNIIAACNDDGAVQLFGACAGSGNIAFGKRQLHRKNIQVFAEGYAGFFKIGSVKAASRIEKGKTAGKGVDGGGIGVISADKVLAPAYGAAGARHMACKVVKSLRGGGKGALCAGNVVFGGGGNFVSFTELCRKGIVHKTFIGTAAFRSESEHAGKHLSTAGFCFGKGVFVAVYGNGGGRGR